MCNRGRATVLQSLALNSEFHCSILLRLGPKRRYSTWKNNPFIGLHCRVVEKHNFDSSLRGNVATLETGNSTREKQSKNHGRHPV